MVTLAFMIMQTDPGEGPSTAYTPSVWGSRWAGVGGLLIKPNALFL